MEKRARDPLEFPCRDEVPAARPLTTTRACFAISQRGASLAIARCNELSHARGVIRTIPLFNRNRAEISIASLRFEQAERMLDAAEHDAEIDQTTLLDLLEAQRSSNEVHLSYYEALSQRAAALIALERAAGLWDIEF